MAFPFDPDKPKCKDPDCDASADSYSLGYCSFHYREYQENYADYLHDSRRDRDWERRSAQDD